MSDTMKPGIHEDIDFADYCKIDAVNASRLKCMAISPEHYHCQDFPEETLSQRFGQMVHTLLLEREKLEERFSFVPDYHLSPKNITKAGTQSQRRGTEYEKAAKADFKEAVLASVNPGDPVPTFLTKDDFRMSEKMLAAITRDAAVNDCLKQSDEARNELTIVWEDEATGLLCKARIDRALPDRLVDIKTTRLADLSEFHRHIHNYQYHNQAAWYQDGWRTLTGDTLPFWFVAINKSLPIQCNAAQLHPSKIAEGRQLNRQYMIAVEHCKKTNKWPGSVSPAFWCEPEELEVTF